MLSLDRPPRFMVLATRSHATVGLVFVNKFRKLRFVFVLNFACWTWWCRPVIPATWEVEAEGSQIQASKGKFQASLGNLVKFCIKIKCF